MCCWYHPRECETKFESRAIGVGVAMSLSLPPPPSLKCTRQFLREAERVNRTPPEWRHRLATTSSIMCGVFKAEFLWHTVLSNENGEFYTYDIYPYLNRSICLLMGSSSSWKLLFKREFPRVLMTCANFKCEVADVNNGIPINFRAVKYVPVESGQPCRDNISWYIQLD